MSAYQSFSNQQQSNSGNVLSEAYRVIGGWMNVITAAGGSREVASLSCNNAALQLSSFLNRFPSFLLSFPASPFNSNSFSGSVQIIRMDGVLPITYMNNRYNIPLRIWLKEDFSCKPPIVFVHPTSSMSIVPNHKYCGQQNGMVYHPYISSWKLESSTLVGLMVALQQVFSAEPPVRAKTTNQPTRSQTDFLTGNSSSFPSASIMQASSQRPSANAMSPYSSSSVAMSISPSTQNIQSHSSPSLLSNFNSTPNAQPTQPTKPTQPTQYASNFNRSNSDSQQQFRYSLPQNTKRDESQHNDMKMAATQKVQLKIAALSNSLSAKVDQRKSDTKMLQNKASVVATEILHTSQSLDKAKNDLHVITEEMKKLETWLEEQNQLNITGETTGDIYHSVDVFTQPKEPLSKQMLELVAEDSAIDDLLYQLNRALGLGLITLEVFLKKTRQLSREQYFVRATMQKIRELQRARQA